MTTSISSEARRNKTSILIRGGENHGHTDIHTDGRTSGYTDGWTDERLYRRMDISIYRVASLLTTKKILHSQLEGAKIQKISLVHT